MPTSTYSIKALPIGESNEDSPGILGGSEDPRKMNVLNVDCSNAREVFGSIVKGLKGVKCDLSGALTEFQIQVADPVTKKWITKQRISCSERGSFQLCYTYTISASNGIFSVTLARTSVGLSVCFGFAVLFLIGFIVLIILALGGHRCLIGSRKKVSGQPQRG